MQRLAVSLSAFALIFAMLVNVVLLVQNANLRSQAASPAPQPTQATPNQDTRLAELQKEWTALKARSDALLNVDIPAFNRKLWDAGIGAIGRENARPIP